MSESSRNGIWFAALLLLCGQGCRSASVCPPEAKPLTARAGDISQPQGPDVAAMPKSTGAPAVPISDAAATLPPKPPKPPSPATVDTSADEPLPLPDPPVAHADGYETAALRRNAKVGRFSANDRRTAPRASISSTRGHRAERVAFRRNAPPITVVPAGHSSQEVSKTLVLDDVVRCVLSSFPLLRAELAGRQVADGRNVSAWSPYDLNFEMYSIAAPMGYYKNYRSGIGLKQAVYDGGYVYGGYRIGRDDVQPWYKERLTNEGGELEVGAGVPLLQGRQIDKYRAEVMTAQVARMAVEPTIQAELLQFIRAASDAYWTWVAAGRMYAAQSQLLQLATQRVQQIEQRVRVGDLEKIALIDNQRLIASRETKLIEAERKLQAAAIKLSLFLRDDSGAPVVAQSGQLPPDWPTPEPYEVARLETDIKQAWTVRPELRYLELQVKQIEIELAAAENMLQPRIDARVQASKDVGAPADPKKKDKSPFELEAGIWGELPLQRRAARGKIQSLQGKLSQLAAKRRYTADKVALDVRDASSALVAAANRIDRARTTVNLARQSLDLGRTGFESGDLTIVTLNLYEKALLDAELQRIEARADYFKAWAALQAALGGAAA